jgi:hypothetical protein
MSQQSKRDLIAAGSIAVMFAGAFIMPRSWGGLVLVALGAVVMLLAILMSVRESQ